MQTFTQNPVCWELREMSKSKSQCCLFHVASGRGVGENTGEEEKKRRRKKIVLLKGEKSILKSKRTNKKKNHTSNFFFS